MNGQIGKQFLYDYLAKTDPIFKEYMDLKIKEARKAGVLPSEIISSFSELARKGKKIRGSLVLLGYKAAGGKDEKRILDTSLFIELAHTGLLVHDDIQDRDNFRRGMPTIHYQFREKGEKLGFFPKEAKHYGLTMGINAGISAYYLSWEKLLEGDFPARRLVKAGKIYSEYILRVSHGQALDGANIFTENANQNELLNILKYKSAEYTGVLPLLIGAVLAGKENEEYLDALTKYGLSLGWAFQIQDDILGAFGNEQEIGKPVGSDFREGKVTLLMLHLAKNGTDKQREIQRKLLGNKKISKEDVSTMQKVLKDSGSYDYVMNLGWKYVKDGEKVIPQITENRKLQEIFRSLLYFMMERTK